MEVVDLVPLEAPDGQIYDFARLIQIPGAVEGVQVTESHVRITDDYVFRNFFGVKKRAREDAELEWVLNPDTADAWQREYDSAEWDRAIFDLLQFDNLQEVQSLWAQSKNHRPSSLPDNLYKMQMTLFGEGDGGDDDTFTVAVQKQLIRFAKQQKVAFNRTTLSRFTWEGLFGEKQELPSALLPAVGYMFLRCRDDADFLPKLNRLLEDGNVWFARVETDWVYHMPNNIVNTAENVWKLIQLLYAVFDGREVKSLCLSDDQDGVLWSSRELWTYPPAFKGQSNPPEEFEELPTVVYAFHGRALGFEGPVPIVNPNLFFRYFPFISKYYTEDTYTVEFALLNADEKARKNWSWGWSRMDVDVYRLLKRKYDSKGVCFFAKFMEYTAFSNTLSETESLLPIVNVFVDEASRGAQACMGMEDRDDYDHGFHLYVMYGTLYGLAHGLTWETLVNKFPNIRSYMTMALLAYAIKFEEMLVEDDILLDAWCSYVMNTDLNRYWEEEEKGPLHRKLLGQFFKIWQASDREDYPLLAKFVFNHLSRKYKRVPTWLLQLMPTEIRQFFENNPLAACMDASQRQDWKAKANQADKLPIWSDEQYMELMIAALNEDQTKDSSWIRTYKDYLEPLSVFKTEGMDPLLGEEQQVKALKEMDHAGLNVRKWARLFPFRSQLPVDSPYPNVRFYANRVLAKILISACAENVSGACVDMIDMHHVDMVWFNDAVGRLADYKWPEHLKSLISQHFAGEVVSSTVADDFLRTLTFKHPSTNETLTGEDAMRYVLDFYAQHTYEVPAGAYVIHAAKNITWLTEGNKPRIPFFTSLWFSLTLGNADIFMEGAYASAVVKDDDPALKTAGIVLLRVTRPLKVVAFTTPVGELPLPSEYNDVDFQDIFKTTRHDRDIATGVMRRVARMLGMDAMLTTATIDAFRAELVGTYGPRNHPQFLGTKGDLRTVPEMVFVSQAGTDALKYETHVEYSNRRFMWQEFAADVADKMNIPYHLVHNMSGCIHKSEHSRTSEPGFMFSNVSDEHNERIVQSRPMAIASMTNASERVQRLAVSGNEQAIKYVSNPVQLETVTQNGLHIQYINNPSVNLQLAAVQQNPKALRHIVNPADEVVSLAEMLSKRVDWDAVCVQHAAGKQLWSTEWYNVKGTKTFHVFENCDTNWSQTEQFENVNVAIKSRQPFKLLRPKLVFRDLYHAVEAIQLSDENAQIAPDPQMVSPMVMRTAKSLRAAQASGDQQWINDIWRNMLNSELEHIEEKVLVPMMESFKACVGMYIDDCAHFFVDTSNHVVGWDWETDKYTAQENLTDIILTAGEALAEYFVIDKVLSEPPYVVSNVTNDSFTLTRTEE